MDCPKCKQPLLEGNPQCPRCDASTLTPPSAPPDPPAQTAFVDDDGTGNEVQWIKWITVIALALFIGVTAWFTLSPIFFGHVHTRSNDSMAKSCLRNLTTCQEEYYVDHEVYTDDFALLTETFDCLCYENVEVNILKADEHGYIAQASHVDSDEVFMIDAYESMDIHLVEPD